MRRERIRVVVLTMAFILCFHLVYAGLIAKAFAYQGYLYRDPGLGWVALAMCFAVAPSLWSPTKVSRLSSFLYWVLYVLTYIPAQIVPYYALPNPGRFLSWSLSLLGAFGIMWPIIRRPVRRRTRGLDSASLFWTCVVCFAVGAYVIASRSGLRLESPDLGSVYPTRFAYRASLAAQGAALAYVVSWTGNVINPLLMSFAFLRRRPLIFFVGLLGQVALFSLTGFKSVLFSPFLVLAAHLCVRLEGRKFARYLLAGLIVVLTAAWLSFWSLGSDFLSYTFVRRMIATPGLLSGFYVDFFSQHAFTLFSHSILRGIISNPYGTPPPFLIGRIYFGSPYTSANANLFADGFAGLGVVGVVLVGIAAAYALRWMDILSNGREWRYMLGVAGVMAFSLSNSALSTTLITHGYLFALFLLSLLPALEDQRHEPIVVLESPRQEATLLVSGYD
jgi:hypothetical protein